MQALKFLMVVSVMLLSGCALTPSNALSPESREPAWFPQYRLSDAASHTLAQTPDITRLTDEQREAFHRWFASPGNQYLTPAQRVDEYLQSNIWGFEFRGETHTASRAMETNAGNCLSLALLTAALADEVNVSISFQEDMSNPIYKQKGSTMLMAKHVRAIIRDPEGSLNDYPHLEPKKIYIDYYEGKIHGDMVDRNALLGMYYRNKAAELLIVDRPELALGYASKAWELNRASSDSINLMAVVLGRVGQQGAADAFYRFAIENQHDNLMLRENYVAFLSRNERHDEAKRIARTIDDAADSNPYNWIWRAKQALDDNDLIMAKKLYLKAKDVAPYLVEPYHGLASVYIEKKQYSHAVDALNKAIKKAWGEQEKQQYQDKLLVLTTLLENN